MCNVKACDTEYLNFTSINNTELIEAWWKLTDEQRDSYGNSETAFTHYLRMEFDRFQKGKTEYK